MGLLADLISKVGLDTRDFQKKIDEAEKRTIRMGRRMSLAGNDLTQNISLPLLALGGYAIKSAADIERLELALKNAMGAGYLDELQKLAQAAKDPGLGFEQAIRGSVALQSVGESADSARRMMQEWGNAVAAAGGTAADLDRVVVQLQQALSKQGALLREDWKFIIQQAPQAQKAMMDLYGTGSTEQLAKQGVTAREAIHAITDELAKLGRVQGGMANAFKTFSDELKQSLRPLGEAIFESASLREAMRGVISAVTGASKAFMELTPQTQKWIVLAGVSAIVLGPLIRFLGSMRVMLAYLFSNLAKVVVGIRGFVDWAGKGTRAATSWAKSMGSASNILRALAVGAARFTGVMSGVTAMIYGAVNAFKFFRKEGEKGSGMLESLNKLGGMGATAYQYQISRGMDRTPKEYMNIVDGLKQVGVAFYDTYNQSIPFKGAMNKASEEVKNLNNDLDDLEDKLSDLQKAWLSFTNKLRSIKELEKIFPADDHINKTRDTIRGMIEELITDFGYAANHPDVSKLIDQLRATREEVQGIIKEIPKLSKLPQALTPTTGIPDLGAASLSRIQESVARRDEVTMYNRGLRSVARLNAGYEDGLITYQEAFLSLTRNYGIEMAKELARGLDNGMALFGPELLDSVGILLTDMKMAIVSGFSETLGAIAGGENPLKAFLQSLVLPLTDILRQFGELLVAAGTARIALSKLALTGVGALVAGSALIATSSAVKSFMNKRLTSLAEGGIAKSPVPALVGDNPRSPELITPLHKLPELMRGVMGNSGGPVIRIQGNMEVDGNKLTYFIDEQVELRKSLSWY